MSSLGRVTVLCALCVLCMRSEAHAQVAAQGMLLHINRAVYGSQGHSKDVTSRLKAMVRNNRLDVTVDNDAMGGDPNEHSKKTLKVDYTFGNRRQSRVVNEHDRLVLP